MAREGATVAVNYAASESHAEALAREITDSGGRAKAYKADVRDTAGVAAMIDSIVRDFGRIDGVVNNAIGGRQEGSMDDATWADYANSFDFGCKHVLNTVGAARPYMKRQGGGSIVNIVTEIWNMAPERWSVYLAGKGAMVGISRSLAAELGPENIRLNMVAPGWMITDREDPTSEGSIAFAKTLPLRRHGSAEEIGNACAFLLSDLSTYITGAYLPVTGGRVTQAGL
jgi:3-oxoacyl-[acyl-carrier protein] reductase